MRILVTGAGRNGFLGNHVKEAFDKYQGKEMSVTYVGREFDLTDMEAVRNVLYLYKPDVIIHMAAICGGILANKNRPATFLMANSLMNINIYEGCREQGIETIYTLGSVCSYPKFCPVPFKEDDLWNGMPEETNAPYGLAKRHLYMMGKTYREQYGIKGAHLIPVNMYGPWDHFDPINSHVIPALIRKFVNAVDKKYDVVDVWGTGKATREFLYAGDCAEAIVKAVKINLNTELPINIGTGIDISIKELAIKIADLTGFNGDIEFTGDVSDGQPKRRLLVDRAKEILDFEAKTSLDEGLLKTIAWFKKQQRNI